MPKPIAVSRPYPPVYQGCPDAYSVRILSPAYASSVGELNTVMQYIYQSFIFLQKGYPRIAELLEGVAVAEMIHFSLLGKTILALGAQPVYSQCPPTCFQFYSTKYVTYCGSLKEMLQDNIRAERHAVRTYQKMLCYLKNQDVRDLIERIIEDEKLHITCFEDALLSLNS